MNSDYLNVVILGNCFYIEETQDKPKGEDALSMLKKIKKIVNENLRFLCTDEYLELSRREKVKEFLRDKAIMIRDGYIEKSADQWFNFFDQSKEVCGIVEETFPPINSFPLPPELTDLIFDWLSLKDGRNLAAVCKNLHAHNAEDIQRKAFGMHYEAIKKALAETRENSSGEASKAENANLEEGPLDYVKKIFEQVNFLIEKKYISDKRLTYKSDGSLDLEKTVENLCILSNREIVELLAKPEVHSASMTLFRLKLMLDEGLRPMSEDLEVLPDSEDFKKDCARALMLTMKSGEWFLLDFLSKCKINFDNTVEGHDLPLVEASLNDSLETVESLLNYGATADAKLYKSETALILTIAASEKLKNAPEIIKFLLEKGANPNQITKGGRSALIYAIYASNKKIVELLLDYKADINKITADGTALMFVIKRCIGLNSSDTTYRLHKNTKMVKFLLKKGANPNIPDVNGIYPLQRVVLSARTHELVKMLLEKKANPNIPGLHENSFLDLVISLNDPILINLIRGYMPKNSSDENSLNE